MPKIIQPLNLGANAFFLKYKKETINEHWLMSHAHQGVELLYIHEGTGTVTLENQQYKLRQNTPEQEDKDGEKKKEMVQ